MNTLFALDAPLPSHPAKYTDVLLLTMAKMLQGRKRILEVAKMELLEYNTGVINRKNDSGGAGNTPLSWPKPTKEVRTMFDSTPFFPQDLETYAPWVTAYGLCAPYGKCQAGCGGDAPLARQSLSKKGYIKDMPTRFCSKGCAQKWLGEHGLAGGRFEKGATTWNKGKKGYWPSPETSFKRGLVPSNKLPIGATTIRIRKREGYPRTYIKVAEPNVWRPRYIVVWELHHGNIPRGYVVHHKDRDTMNDGIDNLELLTRAEHLAEHRMEWS